MTRIPLLVLGLALALTSAPAQQTEEYVFGFLRSHPQRPSLPREQAMEIQKGHMAHLGKMAREDVLAVAGPLNSQDLRGVVLFRGVTLEQARAAAEQDPSVVNGLLVLDAARWRGQAGLRAGPSMPAPAMTKRGLVVYWKTGAAPADWNAPEHRAALTAHAEWARGVRASGAVLAEGLLEGSKEFAGIVVFRDEDPEAALRRCKADPLVERGWARPEALVWYVAERAFLPE